MNFQKLFQIAETGADVILYLLLTVSVISVAMIFERYFTLRRLKSQSEKVGNRIRDILAENNLKDLEDLAKDRESLEGRALGYGIRHAQANGAQGLEEIFNSFILTERPFLDRNLNILATIASNAPYVGLLGTVLGIMKAFDDLAVAAGKNEAVLVGIAHALTATAIGLFVAIPAVIAYNMFQKQVKGIIQSIESVKELCLAYAKTRKS